MATYQLEYHTYSHTVDASTKAKAIKVWYEMLVPNLAPQGVTYKAFAKDCTAVRQKVVKVDTWQCPVDGQRLGRKEFVSHVRQQHGQ